METVNHILSKMREPSCFKGKIPVERVDADFRDFADRIEAAMKQTGKVTYRVDYYPTMPDYYSKVSFIDDDFKLAQDRAKSLSADGKVVVVKITETEEVVWESK